MLQGRSFRKPTQNAVITEPPPQAIAEHYVPTQGPHGRSVMLSEGRAAAPVAPEQYAPAKGPPGTIDSLLQDRFEGRSPGFLGALPQGRPGTLDRVVQKIQTPQQAGPQVSLSSFVQSAGSTPKDQPAFPSQFSTCVPSPRVEGQRYLTPKRHQSPMSSREITYPELHPRDCSRTGEAQDLPLDLTALQAFTKQAEITATSCRAQAEQAERNLQVKIDAAARLQALETRNAFENEVAALTSDLAEKSRLLVESSTQCKALREELHEAKSNDADSIDIGSDKLDVTLSRKEVEVINSREEIYQLKAAISAREEIANAVSARGQSDWELVKQVDQLQVALAARDEVAEVASERAKKNSEHCDRLQSEVIKLCSLIQVQQLDSPRQVVAATEIEIKRLRDGLGGAEHNAQVMSKKANLLESRLLDEQAQMSSLIGRLAKWEQDAVEAAAERNVSSQELNAFRSHIQANGQDGQNKLRDQNEKLQRQLVLSQNHLSRVEADAHSLRGQNEAFRDLEIKLQIAQSQLSRIEAAAELEKSDLSFKYQEVMAELQNASRIQNNAAVSSRASEETEPLRNQNQALREQNEGFINDIDKLEEQLLLGQSQLSRVEANCEQKISDLSTRYEEVVTELYNIKECSHESACAAELKPVAEEAFLLKSQNHAAQEQAQADAAALRLATRQADLLRSQNQAITHRIDELSNAEANAQEEKSELSSQLQEAMSHLQTLKEDASKAWAEAGSVKGLNEVLSDQVEKMEKNFQIVQSEPSMVEAKDQEGKSDWCLRHQKVVIQLQNMKDVASKAQAEAAALREEAEPLRRQHEVLQEVASTAQTEATEEAESLRSQNEALRDQVDKLEEKLLLALANAPVIQSPPSTIGANVERETPLVSGAEAHAGALRTVTEEAESFRCQNGVLMDQVDELQKQVLLDLATVQVADSALSTVEAHVEHENADSSSKYQEVAAQMQNMQEVVSTLQTESAASTGVAKESESLKSQNEALRDEVENLKKQLLVGPGQLSKIEATARQALRNQNEALRKEVEQLEEQLQLAQNQSTPKFTSSQSGCRIAVDPQRAG